MFVELQIISKVLTKKWTDSFVFIVSILQLVFSMEMVQPVFIPDPSFVILMLQHIWISFNGFGEELNEWLSHLKTSIKISIKNRINLLHWKWIEKKNQ